MIYYDWSQSFFYIALPFSSCHVLSSLCHTSSKQFSKHYVTKTWPSTIVLQEKEWTQWREFACCNDFLLQKFEIFLFSLVLKGIFLQKVVATPCASTTFLLATNYNIYISRFFETIRCGKKFVAFFPLDGIKKIPQTFSHT